MYESGLGYVLEGAHRSITGRRAPTVQGHPIKEASHATMTYVTASPWLSTAAQCERLPEPVEDAVHRARDPWAPTVTQVPLCSSFVIFALCDLTIISILGSIPGPLKKPITMHGEVVQWTAFPPQAGTGTVAMEIMSYDGGISIGVSADLVRARSRGGYATQRASSSVSSYTSQGRRGFRPELCCGVSSSRVFNDNE